MADVVTVPSHLSIPGMRIYMGGFSRTCPQPPNAAARSWTTKSGVVADGHDARPNGIWS